MDQQLIVKEEVWIEAPVSKVWEVLIAPKYIRQWDDLPADFGDYYLELGRTVEWSSSRLTVTESEPNEKLVLSLYAHKWEEPPAAYHIAYTYRLSGADGGTKLELEVGDFGVLSDGESYYNASLEFAATALPKIKSLAENRV
jgi:uncharacterized protein YndB with AHSA1/START domain